MRRTNKRDHRQGRERETPERMLDRVLGAFHRWLAEREADPLPLDATDAVRTACELKGSVLGAPNPADWDPEVSVEVLSAIFPRKVLGVDESYIAAIVPGMLTFIDFLTETGRWKTHNDATATRKALTALGPVLPQRFTEPTRLSMGGRVIQLAIDEGVDVSDPQALGGFMQRFNEMPFEWRKRLTDGPETVDDHDGHIPDEERYERLDGSPFDSPEALDALNEAILAAATAVGFTGEPVVITVPGAESELAGLSGIPLLTRMAALAEWVRPGQKVTATGALRRDDTAEWLRRFGSHVAGWAPNSMWDCPELAIPWSVAASVGLIDIATTKAYPGPDNDIFTAGDAPRQIRCGRAAVNLLLHNLIGSGDELTELDRVVTGLLLPVLACLCGPGGADLTPLRTLADQLLSTPSVSASDTLSGIVFRVVLNIVDMLREWGVVSVSGKKMSVPNELRPAVVGAIYAPGAPFTLRLRPGAVPLDV